MSLVTIGLDFGTSSVKCVARPALARNDRVEVLPSDDGSLRWRSMLGYVREGRDAGRLLLFEECDEERWRFAAVIESNLKLALLTSPQSQTAEALRSRWECENHYALPTLLLAAALQRALARTQSRWPDRVVHIFCGAPVSPRHPKSQTILFERALAAAARLCDAWNGSPPLVAAQALREADAAWTASMVLPSEEERKTFVVPEAFAACEGVASAGGSVRLPLGRLCIVDMGGGTTDVAWIANAGGNEYHPLRIDSFDIAGDRLEALVAARASGRARRRVRRLEIWQARQAWTSSDPVLRGDDWALGLEEIQATLKDTLKELSKRLRAVIQAIDPGVAKSPRTTFIFVGGATQWQPIADLFIESVADLHEGVATIAVAELGLSQPTSGVPLAVALGLSNGHTTLDLQRWDGATRLVQVTSSDAAATRFPWCPCNGLLPLCPQCGGSGMKDSVSGESRFHGGIDPFRLHAFSVRCPHCQVDFPRDRIFAHIDLSHSDATAIIKPPPSRRTQADGRKLSMPCVRTALATDDNRSLSSPEQVLVEDIRWLHQACVARGPGAQEISERFLRHSVMLSETYPWIRLLRAIAFAILGDRKDADRELSLASSAGFGYSDSVAAILNSARETRFVEAWESIVR